MPPAVPPPLPQYPSQPDGERVTIKRRKNPNNMRGMAEYSPPCPRQVSDPSRKLHRFAGKIHF